MFSRRPTPDPVGPGQESVWDYPRPPALKPSNEHVLVVLGGQAIVDTRDSWRVMETSHPPTYYVSPDGIAPGVLVPAAGSSWCEWKGAASYYDIVVGDLVLSRAAWTYRDPTRAFAPIRDYVALYPGLMDEVTVDGERVRPQEGGFYGGWITSRVVGPFKGGPGSAGW